MSVESRDQELFNRIAKAYSYKDAVPSSSIARKYQLQAALKPFLKKDQIKNLTEVACGVGASAKYLKDYYENYTGVDYSEELVKEAWLFNQENLKAKFIVKNVKDLSPDMTEPADLVLAIGALHHFTEVDQALSGIKAVAKPGARFVALEPQSNNPIIQYMRRLRMKSDEDYSPEQHFFTKKVLQEILIRNGFKNITFQYQGFFTPPFAQVPMFPQWLFIPLSRMVTILDTLIDYLPDFLKWLSWNIIVRAEFP